MLFFCKLIFRLYVVYMSLFFISIPCVVCCFCFFQAEDGIRDLVRSRGLGDVYKRQHAPEVQFVAMRTGVSWGYRDNQFARYFSEARRVELCILPYHVLYPCLLYTSDAADDLLCVDLGGRRIIKKKTTNRK